MNSTDLKVIRQYTHKGINIMVEIDKVAGRASFVEPVPGSKGDYKHKTWLFGDRTLDYVKSWGVILEAMQKVNQELVAELEAYEERKLEDTAKLHMAISEGDKLSKKNKKPTFSEN